MQLADCQCKLTRDVDYYNLPLACPKVWDMLARGLVKGIFQLESQLCKQWTKEIKPKNINDISAIIALVRPGTLQAKVENKNMTKHYADRKNKIDPVPKYHPIFDDILKDTFGVITFQEQAITIAQLLAGFNLSEADSLRKAMGKKIAELMAKVEKNFMEKAKGYGVITEEQAKYIFHQIKASQRYSFNKCLTLDTVVTTQDGLKTLEEVQIGELVLAPNLETKIDEFIQVINKYINGTKELYEITLESGKTIKCTMDHKFLAEDMIIYTLEEIIEKNLKIMCESD